MCECLLSSVFRLDWRLLRQATNQCGKGSDDGNCLPTIAQVPARISECLINDCVIVNSSRLCVDVRCKPIDCLSITLMMIRFRSLVA